MLAAWTACQSHQLQTFISPSVSFDFSSGNFIEISEIQTIIVGPEHVFQGMQHDFQEHFLYSRLSLDFSCILLLTLDL